MKIIVKSLDMKRPFGLIMNMEGQCHFYEVVS